MASAVVALSNLAVKLGDLVLQEGNYLDGGGEKLRRLETEVVWMNGFLKDAAAAGGSQKEVVATWVAEVRELAYEAEDITDSFVIKAPSKRRSCILKEDWWLHKMGKRMDELTEKIAVLTRRAQTYGIQQAADARERSARRMPPKETFPNEIEKDVVGFDGYTKRLVSVLKDEREQKDVVVIAGMGGLGKTTLAKKVFHHREIGGHFEQFAWVYVSQQYQKMHVWQQILLDLEFPTTERRPKVRARLIRKNTKRNEILNSTDREEQEQIRPKREKRILKLTDREEQEQIRLELKKEILNLTEEDLKRRIEKNLQEKKCLVVLDDVWGNENWDLLGAPFRMDPQRNLSKILITSRHETVAESTNRFLLPLACLNPEQSWELLRKIVFPPREGTEMTIKIGDPEQNLAQEGAETINEMDDVEMDSAQEDAERTTMTEGPKKTLEKECAAVRTTKTVDPKRTLEKESEERTTKAEDSNRTSGKEAAGTIDEEKLAREMVRHCGGLPLAIRVLGGLLTASSIDEWSTIKKDIKPLIARGGNQGQENTGVRDILATSYENLPAQLKSCFIYMAQFPEDYEISVDKLEKMWIAEGMVEPVQVHWEERQEELEDIAKRYMNQLIQRSMVLVGKRGPDNELETCRLHDLMRDFCLSKAKEENMLQVLNQTVNDGKSGAYAMSKVGNARRLAIHELRTLYPNPHLRSLWFFSDIFPSTEDEANFDEFSPSLADAWKFFWPSRQLLAFVTNKYKLLRVLDLDGVPLVSITLPSEIGELIYLKMLTFGEIMVIKLPSSLGKLRCLQTLDLKRAVVQYWLPNVVWKLEQLRHLHLPSSYRIWTFKIGRWRNLRTLRNFRLRQRGEAKSLGELTQLRELGIAITQDLLKAFSCALAELKNLRSLSISIRTPGGQSIDLKPIFEALIKSGSNVYKLELSGEQLALIEFPEDVVTKATIKHLALSDCWCDESLMSKLGKFPNLRFLTFSFLLGPSQRRCTQGFHQLVFLALDGLIFLHEFIIDEGAMPILERMEIRFCVNLERAPKGLKYMESLQELKIIRMSKAFNDRLVPGGADYEEVQKIPSVLLMDPLSSIFDESRSGGSS